MRIKKVSQTTSTQAQVVDGYSTSTTDSYSCNYVNGITGKILWANSNPDDDFVAQTVTLSESLSNYDKYEIIFKQGSGSSDLRVLSTGIIPTLYGTILSYAVNNRYRLVDVPNGNQITFQSGMNNNSADNTKCLPLYIIGYKNN